MRPTTLPIDLDLWPEAYRPRPEPARPQPVLELPLPVRRPPPPERCDDEQRGVTIIDLLGD